MSKGLDLLGSSAPEGNTRAHWAIAHIIVLLVVLAIVAAASGQIDPDEHPNMDLNKYRAMASASPGIVDDVPRPFVYRLLGPYIVGLLPFDIDTGFYALTLVLSYSLLILLYLFLCFLGIDARIALLTTILYALNYYQFNYHIWNYFQITDLLTLVCGLVLLRAMLGLKWVVFAVALALGVVCRETPLIMIPVAFVYLAEQRLLSAEGPRFLISVFPAIAIFVIIRLLVPHSGGMGLLEAISDNAAKFMIPTTWLNLLVRPFTPLTFLVIVFLRDTFDFFRGRKYLLCLFLLVALSTLFGRDTERLMAPAFVVFYVPLAVILQRHIKENWVFISFLLVMAFGRSFYYLIAPDSLPSVNSERIAATVPAVIVAVVGFWFKARHAMPAHKATAENARH